MSLAARCSHCQTVFRIAGPQLAAAQGWVRCGHCSQVFDAASNLVTPEGYPLDVPTVDAPVSAPALSPTISPAMSNAAPNALPDFEAPSSVQSLPDIDLELPDLGPLKAEALARSAPPPPAMPPADEPELEPELKSEPATAAAKPPEANEPVAADGREPFWVEPPAPAAGGLETPPLPDIRELPALPLQAMRESVSSPDTRSASNAAEPARAPTASKSSSAPRRPWVGGLAVAALLLSFLAMSGYALRAHIAQAWPEARPLVIQVCQAINCSLPPLRLIEALDIQGSSLSHDDEAGLHRLRLSVRHQGDWPMQMPAFDLSLLDEDGQVLARRMIDPIEFENTLSVMAPGTETTLTLVMNLKAIQAQAIGSFKVVPFYP